MSKNKSQIKIGVILGYLNVVVGNLIPFFYTPLMLELLGQNEHGLYKLANSAASYLTLAAFGIGAAVTRYLIKARAEEGKEAEERMFGLFNLLFWAIAAITLIAGTIIAFNLDSFYSNSLTPTELDRMTILVLIIAVNTAVGFASSAYNAVVSSHEKFLFLQIINLCITCVSPIVNLIALYMGYASIGMTVSTLIITVVVRILYMIYVKVVLDLKPRYNNLPVKLIKEILQFSFWVFVSSVVNQLYSATDVMIIGAVPALATAAVSVYNVGSVFSHIVSSLGQTVSNLLTPKANKMVFGKASDKEISDLVIRIGRYQCILIALFCSGFIAFGYPFVKWYAGSAYTEAYFVAVLIMIPSCIPLIQSVALSVVVARNKHRFRSLVYLFIAVINVVGTYLIVNYRTPSKAATAVIAGLRNVPGIELSPNIFGITGAALVTCISYIIGPGIIMNWYYWKRMKLDMPRFWRNILKLIWIPVLMCVGTLFLGNYIDFDNKAILLSGIGIYTVTYCVLTYLFAMNKEEKNLVGSVVGKVIRRKKAHPSQAVISENSTENVKCKSISNTSENPSASDEKLADADNSKDE